MDMSGLRSLPPAPPREREAGILSDAWRMGEGDASSGRRSSGAILDEAMDRWEAFQPSKCMAMMLGLRCSCGCVSPVSLNEIPIAMRMSCIVPTRM